MFELSRIVLFMLAALNRVCGLENILTCSVPALNSRCNITIQSFGLVQPNCSVRNARLQTAFVELNQDRKWSACFCGNDRRGIHTMLIDPFSCREVTDVRQFDAYASPDNAEDLATYLTMLRDGQVVVVVTVDDPYRNVNPALRTLKFLGADVSDVGFRGAFAVVAQKGFPFKTVLAKRLVNDGPGLVKMSVTVIGLCRENFVLKRDAVRLTSPQEMELAEGTNETVIDQWTSSSL